MLISDFTLQYVIRLADYWEERICQPKANMSPLEMPNVSTETETASKKVAGMFCPTAPISF